MKKDDHNTSRKKINILIYIIILLSFIFVSINIFSNSKETKNVIENNNHNEISSEKNTTENKEKEDFTSDESVSDSSEEGTEYEAECKEVVEKFLNSYHKISDNNRLLEIENVSDLLTEPQYEMLKEKINQEDKKEYAYRTIEDMSITEYYFNTEEKDVTINATVTSNLLDDNGKVIKSNDVTEYIFMLSNNMGSWKIGLFSEEAV